MFYFERPIASGAVAVADPKATFRAGTFRRLQRKVGLRAQTAYTPEAAWNPTPSGGASEYIPLRYSVRWYTVSRKSPPSEGPGVQDHWHEGHRGTRRGVAVAGAGANRSPASSVANDGREAGL
jgi:hypothetical protein